MNVLRKLALILITPLFSLLLFATAFDMGVLRVAGQPNEIKQVLRDSGVYGNAVNSLLSQAKQQTSDRGSVSLTNPSVVAAANATFTPQYIQQNTETVIDSVYAWLNGKTAQPDFNIDLSSLKGKFATNVAQAVQQKAATLPGCADAASAAAALNDPVSAACLPAGVTPAAVGSEVQGDILGGKGFLDNVVINANSIKAGDSSCNGLAASDCRPNQQVPVFTHQLKNVPTQFQRVKKSPIILSALALLVAVAIVFLSSSRRKGLRHVGIILLVMGLFMLLLAWGLDQGITKEVPKIKLNNAVVQNDVRKIVSDLAKQIDHNYWIFGGVYATVGVLVIASAILWNGKNNKSKTYRGIKGEGKTAEDRIDLREPDAVTPLAETESEPKKTTKPAAKKNIKVK